MVLRFRLTPLRFTLFLYRDGARLCALRRPPGCHVEGALLVRILRVQLAPGIAARHIHLEAPSPATRSRQAYERRNRRIITFDPETRCYGFSTRLPGMRPHWVIDTFDSLEAVMPLDRSLARARVGRTERRG